jgi:hypothetical protein
MHQKTELSNIYREDSGALINKNNGALIEYKRKRQELSKMMKLEKQIETLQNEVSVLKETMQKILINFKD